MKRETTEYDGQIYYRYPESPRRSDRVYYKKITLYLHKKIWEDAYGEIPKGFHIHHKDGNTGNNSLGNLEILSCKDHRGKHEKAMTQKQKDARKNNMDEIRPMTKKWHASQEGHEWHKKHGIEGWDKRNEFEKTCMQCGKLFLTKTYHQTFCSNACRAADRRARGVDDIKKICPVCGKEYVVSKYSKGLTCSKACGRSYIKQKNAAVFAMGS